jgi:hypothetical protein
MLLSAKHHHMLEGTSPSRVMLSCLYHLLYWHMLCVVCMVSCAALCGFVGMTALCEELALAQDVGSNHGRGPM